MPSYNRVILMGHLTRDPELRTTQSGTTFAKSGIAVNERMPDGQGGHRDSVSFFDVTFFGKRAESFAKWFQKGSAIHIEGKLRQNTWQDRETGQNRSKVEVIGDNWTFAGGKGDQTQTQAQPEAQPAGAATSGGGDQIPDDVPF